MSFDELSVVINRALFRFQFIEEGIKIYLESAYLIVKVKLDGVLRVRLTRKQIETKSLRQLISEFEKFSENDPLVADLKQLVEDRNFVAHQAFLVGASQLGNVDSLRQHIDKINSISGKAEKCVETLMKEIKAVEAKLKGEIPSE